MAKSWTIGNSLVTVVDGEVSLFYKTYPGVSVTVPEKAHWLLTRKPVITLVGGGQIWIRFKQDERSAHVLVKFQVSTDFGSLKFVHGRYYSRYDKNLVLTRDELDF